MRKGLIDHSDSLGATARFGGGDVQWLTAGRGIVHAEMFPLLDEAAPNPLELFQIWLNLPARNKMAQPHFTMFWAEDIPRFTAMDARRPLDRGREHRGRIAPIEGEPGAGGPLAPPPDSWAAQPDADVAIWTVKMEPQACWTLPAATGEGTRRTLYFFKGRVGQRGGAAGRPAMPRSSCAPTRAVELVNGDEDERVPAAAGPPDRRAGGAVRPLRDEHAGRDRAGHGRLPPHAVRRLAVGRHGAGAWAQIRRALRGIRTGAKSAPRKPLPRPWQRCAAEPVVQPQPAGGCTNQRPSAPWWRATLVKK